jgi:hypothetical protein
LGVATPKDPFPGKFEISEVQKLARVASGHAINLPWAGGPSFLSLTRSSLRRDPEDSTIASNSKVRDCGFGMLGMTVEGIVTSSQSL